MKTLNVKHKPSILDTIEVGTIITGKMRDGRPVNGTVMSFDPVNTNYLIDDNGQPVTVMRRHIYTVGGRLVYNSIIDGNNKSHPELEFTVDFANEEQLKGSLSDVEIHRQTARHFADASAATYRQLVSSHTSVIFAALRGLEKLGEFNTIADVAEQMYNASTYPATHYQEFSNPDGNQDFEYRMAIHHKMKAAFLRCGKSELEEYLNEKGIEKFMSDFKD